MVQVRNIKEGKKEKRHQKQKKIPLKTAIKKKSFKKIIRNQKMEGKIFMGRIKTIAIKTLGDELIKKHGNKFFDDFDKNKRVLEEFQKVKSKRTRNILAGYITGKMQKIKKSGI